jgi:hypothetical protein
MKNKLFAIITLVIVAFTVFELLPESRSAIAIKSHQSDVYESIAYIPRLQVLYSAQNGDIYGMEDHFVYVSSDNGETFTQLGHLPKIESGVFPRIKDKIARLRLTRLLRDNPGPNNLVVLSSGTILVFWDHIYRSSDGGRTFESVFDFAEHGIAGPFGFEGVTVGGDDSVFFGEYDTSTKGPHPIQIVHGLNDGRTWEVAHTFESGKIRHIHSIQYDRYRDQYWICTGDRDDEAGLYFTTDKFETLDKLGGGSQDWRIVSLMIAEDYLYWGTDNSQTGSSIFRWNMEMRSLEKMMDLGNVVYYSTILRDGTLVLSTTVEPNSQFTQENNPSQTTELWVSKDQLEWQRLLSMAGDGRLTSHGPSRASIAFPGGEPLEAIIYMPQNTAEHNFTSQIIRP